MGKDRYKYFRIEARELLEGLSRGALDLEKAPADRQLVARLLRYAHTLKGAARVVQLPAIAELAHEAEDALGPHRDQQSPPVPREAIDLLLRIVAQVVAMLSGLEPIPPDAGPGGPGGTAGAAGGVGAGRPTGAGGPSGAAGVIRAGGTSGTGGTTGPIDAGGEAGPSESGGPAGRAGAAGPHGTGEAARTGAAAGAAGAARSGAAAEGGVRSGEAAGAGAARAGTAPGPREEGAASGADSGGGASKAGSGGEPASGGRGTGGSGGTGAGEGTGGGGPGTGGVLVAAPIEDFRSVRVDLAELDSVLDSVLQAGVQATSLARQLDRLEQVQELARALSEHLARSASEDVAMTRARAFVTELRRALTETRESLGTSADLAVREIGEAQRSADRLRLLPARAIFGSLERAARDAARATDRTVAFETSGGDLRVDAHVLSLIREALMHVVRNAIAHGIESPGERRRRGKPPGGKVTVSVERRGSRLAFTCSDDGRGIDRVAVRNAAVEKGLVSREQAATLEGDALTDVLLHGGLTTRRTVSDLAGRGVGLDVVRETATRLEGQVSIRTEPGAGTTVQMIVPMSLAAMTVLHAESAGVVVALPLDGVRSTAFLEPSRMARTGDGTAVSWEGQLVPFLPLSDVLGRPQPDERRRFWSTVLVESGGRLVALGADRLHGTSDVVVRPLPPFVEAHAAVAGASLDAEGNPQVVLDPAGLVSSAISREWVTEEAAPRVRPPILVIDDSLTTRMLEQSILESAGYEVELAVSAEEGLAKARARRFGVFVVDVEMPGMDGFEFVRVTRADARLSQTPAILVTSRSAPEDRQQGTDAGASAYIVKGEFDQGRLLATIRELMG